MEAESATETSFLVKNSITDRVKEGEECVGEPCAIVRALQQCFSTAGPRPSTGPWDQLYRAARDAPGIDN